MEMFDRKAKALLAVIVGLLIVIVGMAFYITRQKREVSPAHETIILPEDYASNENVLQNTVGLRKSDAKEVAEVIRGDRKSDITDSYTEYETDDEGHYAPIVSHKIEAKDPTLPPAAIKKTDKTVVVESKDEETGGAKVDVYKINTYRNWEFGMGVGRHDGDNYGVVSIQRNYDKAHSVAVEGHWSIDKNEFNGAEVQWKVHF